MLTPAQQKLRQELEELQVKGLLQPKQETPPPRVRHRRKRWPIYLIVILLLTIICSVYYTKWNNQQHQMMNDYIIKVQKYNAKSTVLLKEFQDGSLTQADLHEAVNEQNQLLQNTIKLSPPEPFHEHHQYFIEVMKQREITLSSFISTNNSNLLLNKLAKDCFLKALKKEKFKYQILEDGTIEFWIDSKSYQY